MDRALLAFRSDREKARQLVRDALEAALAAHDPTLVCLIRFHLGEFATGFSDAEAHYRAALADAERQRDPYLIAWARMGLGFIRARDGRFDEAVPFLEQSREIAQQVGAKSIVAAADGNLGWCYFRLGDLDKAMDAFRRAEALSGKIGFRDSQHRWLGAIGNIYLEWGDLDRAMDYERRAAALAREVGNEEWLAIALNNLAEISLQKGDLAAAQDFNSQALSIKRRLGNPWSLAYSELNAAEIEAREGKYAQAETDYRAVIQAAPGANAPDVLCRAYGALAMLYQSTHRPRLAEAQFRKSIGTIDRQWNELGSDEWKTTFLAPRYLIGLFQDYAAFLVAQGQIERALEMAESSRARVLTQRLRRAEALATDFRVDKLVSAARASHTVILSYWLAPVHSSVWAIGPGGLSHHPLPPDKEIGELVRKHTETITQGRDPLAPDNAAVSSALYQAVLAPLQKLISPGSNVIIVLDGALHQLNFETLVVPAPQPHYWIEDVAIATAPSLHVLQGAEDRPAPAAAVRAPTLLLFGDPVLTSQEFPPLPNVKMEVAAVEQYFPAANRSVFTGARAVPEEYKNAAPANFTNIHFASHATANRESPLNSAIILSHRGENFKLYARDVAAVHLTADLVTISACKSAGPKAYSGEGLMGFAWAFLQSGARNVIATLWDEDDATAVDLMRRLYAGIAAGESPARALRSAKLTLLHAGNSFRLPYYWGPLQVFTRRVGR